MQQAATATTMSSQAVLRKLFDDFAESKDFPKVVMDFIRCYGQLGDMYKEIWVSTFDREFVKRIIGGGFSARQAMWAAEKLCEGMAVGYVVQSGLINERQLKSKYETSVVLYLLLF